MADGRGYTPFQQDQLRIRELMGREEELRARIATLEKERDEARERVHTALAWVTSAMASQGSRGMYKKLEGIRGALNGVAAQYEHEGYRREREMRARVATLEAALRECEDYFDQRADADCAGDPAAYAGNREMTLLGIVRRALRGLEGK